jgi:alkylhydroperoxidase/carboxymuconolactone decarboxylase family protein YurZ
MNRLTDTELAIGPVAAATAIGDMPALSAALESALDAGVSVNELKEVLVQLYAYAGFPRALNALGNLMRVLQDRQRRGLHDTEGARPGPVPSPQAMLEAGTANQTALAGAPVTGPLFDFAPAIDQFLKAHLFGDIFARDNLPWASRELATVAALAALDGVEPQLQAHIRISLNVGLTVEQLDQFADELAAGGAGLAARRARAALGPHRESV